MQRLKNKLGNWANASSEVEFRGALAWMVGEEGRGVPTIIEMVALTRFAFKCQVGQHVLHQRLLGRDGGPVAGLYACGNDMNSIMAGAYPGAGITLGPALTFGFIAGRALASEPDRLPR